MQDSYDYAAFMALKNNYNILCVYTNTVQEQVYTNQTTITQLNAVYGMLT